MTETSPQYNGEEFHDEYVRDMQKRMFTQFENAKKNIDTCENTAYCISFLDLIKTIYNDELIPVLKEDYLNDPSNSRLYISRANYVHKTFDDLYQHIVKRLETLGLPPSKLPSQLPKSLEKLTFPENN